MICAICFYSEECPAKADWRTENDCCRYRKKEIIMKENDLEKFKHDMELTEMIIKKQQDVCFVEMFQTKFFDEFIKPLIKKDNRDVEIDKLKAQIRDLEEQIEDYNANLREIEELACNRY